MKMRWKGSDRKVLCSETVHKAWPLSPLLVIVMRLFFCSDTCLIVIVYLSSF